MSTNETIREDIEKAIALINRVGTSYIPEECHRDLEEALAILRATLSTSKGEGQ